MEAILTNSSVVVRTLGFAEYEIAWQNMRSFTEHRQSDTVDELWCLQHPPVFTQGQAGKPEHILHTGDIPVIQTDRGGQVTYHGPGQWIIYLLVDIRRKGWGIRSFVCKIEKAVVDMLAQYGIMGSTNAKAPGVYVEGAKICSLGLRVRRGASYHGLSLNVDMDLSPFQGINPCGFSNLPVVQMKDFMHLLDFDEVKDRLIQHLCRHLGYTAIQYADREYTDIEYVEG